MKRGFDQVTIHLLLDRRFEARSGNTVLLSDIQGTLSGSIEANDWRVIGRGGVIGIVTTASTAFETPMSVPIHCSPKAIAEYEHSRNGGPVRLSCELSGTSYELIPTQGSVQGALADPQQVAGSIQIDVPKEAWTEALRTCGLSASILIEIPLAIGGSGQVDEGLQAVADAFEAFEHGGTTAWKNTIAHIRPYLETWQTQEPVDGKEPRDGSLLDRKWKLLTARDALLRCCHLWMHEVKGGCSRADALFALSSFASLLKTYRS